MKIKMIPLFVAAGLILSGCGNNTATENVSEETIISEGSYAAGERKTVSEIKAGYSNSDSGSELVPIYNVAPDETFDFKFGFDYMEHYDPSLEYVTVHTDKKCRDESKIYTYADAEGTSDGGCMITVSPMRAVLENNTDEEDYFENDHAIWGNAPVYYIAVWYDTEADSPQKLKKPKVIPFTVKHDVPAPEVRGVVDSQGRFSLRWEPVEGAEEYRVYVLKDSGLWTGEDNHPLYAAENGFDFSLLYEKSVKETYFDDFDGGGGNIVVHRDRANGREYVIGQNYCVNGEYYVSAVKDGKESGFARGITTADLKLPYKPTEKSDIMYERYDDISKLPLSLDIINIDGSVTSRKVMYTFIMSDTYIDGFKVPAYEYSVEGTAISGYVGMDIDDVDFDYPETIGSITSAGFSEPKNNISSVPDADIDSGGGSSAGGTAYERQVSATERHREKGGEAFVSPLTEGVKIFADSAEEEWLAVNLANGEENISLEAFPKLWIYDELEDVFHKVYYQNPYILGVYCFSYDYADMALEVEYVYDKGEIADMQREIAAQADNVISEIISAEMTAEEKQNAVYTYLENAAEYDYGALENAKKNDYIKTGESDYEYAFNTYGVLVKKEGVCQSYAYVYKLLCSMCGIECSVVTGYIDGSLPHAWNAVSIDGERFQTDVTNNFKNTGIPYLLYNSDIDTAEITGYTCNGLYETDANLNGYFSNNPEYEYYHANGLCASTIKEFKSVLDGEADKDGDIICIRYTEDIPEQSEIANAVAEVYYRKNREDELDFLALGISESFVLICEKD